MYTIEDLRNVEKEIAELSENEQQDILDYFNLGYKVSLEQVKAIKNKEKSTDIIEAPEEKNKVSTKVTIPRKIGRENSAECKGYNIQEET